MNVARMMRDTFSPHELAVLAVPPGLIISACGIGLIGSAHLLLGLLLLALAAGWIIFFWILSLCPACGKSPWVLYPFSSDSLFAKWQRGRLWPEHECSACRTSLDGI